MNMSWFYSAAPYLLALGTLALGVFSLLKDWHSHSPTGRRAVAVFLCAVAGLTLIRQYNEDAQRNTERQKQAEAAKRLDGQVAAANEAQKANTAMYLDSFGKLSQKVSDLQTQVKTDELQKRLANVQAELQATEKALAPGPKARLQFTFVPFHNPPANSGDPVRPITETTLPVDSEHTVHILFSILNLTDVAASDGEITLIICEPCRFAKEPAGFTKLPGENETHRFKTFQNMLPQVSYTEGPIDVIINDDTIQRIAIGFQYRCRTCIVEKTPPMGIVNLTRPFVRPFVVAPKHKSDR